MNQLPIIYQERFTFDSLLYSIKNFLSLKSFWIILNFQLLEDFQAFRFYNPQFFEQWKGKIMKRKICEDFSDNFAEANQNTESDDDFNKLFPVHVDSTFDFFTHLRQRFTQEWPF